jgi:hypothetical protein
MESSTRFQFFKQHFVLLIFSSELLEEEKGIRKKISFFNILGEYFERV